MESNVRWMKNFSTHDELDEEYGVGEGGAAFHVWRLLKRTDGIYCSSLECFTDSSPALCYATTAGRCPLELHLNTPFDVCDITILLPLCYACFSDLRLLEK